MYTSPQTLVIHNLGCPPNILQISEDQFSRLSQSYNLTVTILFTPDTRTEKLVPIEKKQRKQNKQQQLSSKQKGKKEIATLRRSVLENTVLQCIQCNSTTSFRCIRHKAEKREFLIVPYKSYEDAIQLLISNVLLICKRGNSKAIDIYSSSCDADRKVIERLNQIDVRCYHHPFICPPTSDIRSVSRSPQFFSSTGQQDKEKSSPISMVTTRIKNWIQERNESGTGLPKSREKLNNAVSSLLRVKSDETEVKSILPFVIDRLKPSLCPSCKSLHLNGIRAYNEFKEITQKTSNKSILSSLKSESKVPSYVLSLDEDPEIPTTLKNNDEEDEMDWSCDLDAKTDPISQKDFDFWEIVPGKEIPQKEMEKGLSDFEILVLRRCIEIFSKQKDLPGSMEALASAIVANCTFSNSVEFDLVFSRLLDEGIIAQTEDYSLAYFF